MLKYSYTYKKMQWHRWSLGNHHFLIENRTHIHQRRESTRNIYRFEKYRIYFSDILHNTSKIPQSIIVLGKLGSYSKAPPHTHNPLDKILDFAKGSPADYCIKLAV